MRSPLELKVPGAPDGGVARHGEAVSFRSDVNVSRELDKTPPVGDRLPAAGESHQADDGLCGQILGSPLDYLGLLSEQHDLTVCTKTV